jgi:hypothetical protein
MWPWPVLRDKPLIRRKHTRYISIRFMLFYDAVSSVHSVATVKRVADVEIACWSRPYVTRRTRVYTVPIFDIHVCNAVPMFDIHVCNTVPIFDIHVCNTVPIFDIHVCIQSIFDIHVCIQSRYSTYTCVYSPDIRHTLQWTSGATTAVDLHDFRLPPRCGWDLRPSAILRSVEW